MSPVSEVFGKKVIKFSTVYAFFNCGKGQKVFPPHKIEILLQLLLNMDVYVKYNVFLFVSGLNWGHFF